MMKWLLICLVGFLSGSFLTSTVLHAQTLRSEQRKILAYYNQGEEFELFLSHLNRYVSADTAATRQKAEEDLHKQVQKAILGSGDRFRELVLRAYRNPEGPDDLDGFALRQRFVTFYERLNPALKGELSINPVALAELYGNFPSSKDLMEWLPLNSYSEGDRERIIDKIRQLTTVHFAFDSYFSVLARAQEDPLRAKRLEAFETPFSDTEGPDKNSRMRTFFINLARTGLIENFYELVPPSSRPDLYERLIEALLDSENPEFRDQFLSSGGIANGSFASILDALNGTAENPALKDYVTVVSESLSKNGLSIEELAEKANSRNGLSAEEKAVVMEAVFKKTNSLVNRPDLSLSIFNPAKHFNSVPLSVPQSFFWTRLKQASQKQIGTGYGYTPSPQFERFAEEDLANLAKQKNSLSNWYYAEVPLALTVPLAMTVTSWKWGRSKLRQKALPAVSPMSEYHELVNHWFSAEKGGAITEKEATQASEAVAKAKQRFQSKLSQNRCRWSLFQIRRRLGPGFEPAESGRVYEAIRNSGVPHASGKVAEFFENAQTREKLIGNSLGDIPSLEVQYTRLAKAQRTVASLDNLIATTSYKEPASVAALLEQRDAAFKEAVEAFKALGAARRENLAFLKSSADEVKGYLQNEIGEMSLDGNKRAKIVAGSRQSAAQLFAKSLTEAGLLDLRAVISEIRFDNSSAHELVTAIFSDNPGHYFSSPERSELLPKDRERFQAIISDPIELYRFRQKILRTYAADTQLPEAVRKKFELLSMLTETQFDSIQNVKKGFIGRVHFSENEAAKFANHLFAAFFSATPADKARDLERLLAADSREFSQSLATMLGISDPGDRRLQRLAGLSSARLAEVKAQIFGFDKLTYSGKPLKTVIHNTEHLIKKTGAGVPYTGFGSALTAYLIDRGQRQPTIPWAPWIMPGHIRSERPEEEARPLGGRTRIPNRPEVSSLPYRATFTALSAGTGLLLATGTIGSYYWMWEIAENLARSRQAALGAGDVGEGDLKFDKDEGLAILKTEFRGDVMAFIKRYVLGEIRDPSQGLASVEAERTLRSLIFANDLMGSETVILKKDGVQDPVLVTTKQLNHLIGDLDSEFPHLFRYFYMINPRAEEVILFKLVKDPESGPRYDVFRKSWDRPFFDAVNWDDKDRPKVQRVPGDEGKTKLLKISPEKLRHWLSPEDPEKTGGFRE